MLTFYGLKNLTFGVPESYSFPHHSPNILRPDIPVAYLKHRSVSLPLFLLECVSGYGFVG